jgi:hypothetical protein
LVAPWRFSRFEDAAGLVARMIPVGAGDAADIRATFGASGRSELVLGDDVGDPDPPAGNQDAEHLGEHGRFVGRQVDRTVWTSIELGHNLAHNKRHVNNSRPR